MSFMKTLRLHVLLFKNLTWLTNKKKWTGVKAFGEEISTVRRNGKLNTGHRYFGHFR